MVKKIHKAVCIFGANFILEQVNALENEAEGAMEGDDIEFIHRLRVASRRVRSGLENFKKCFPKKVVKNWQDEIRQITHALGNARDLDIQIELINSLYDETLGANEKHGYRRLLLRLKQRREKAQKKVNKTIVKLQQGSLLNEMRSQLEQVSVNIDNSYLYTPALYQKAFKAINSTLEDFLSYQQHLQSPEKVDKLHAMRIAGKNLRYTMEIFEPIYDQALTPHVQVMKALQDQLGDIHDCDVWVSWLPKFIKKERARIEDYFGNVEPLNQLLPGIHHLIEDRQKVRDEAYRSLLATWEMLQYENTWQVLNDIIKAPFDVDSVLDQDAEEEFERVSEEQEHEPSTFEVELTPDITDEPYDESDFGAGAD